MMRLSLHFIAGAQSGQQVPLPADGRVVLGRTAEADLRLAEEMVSRRHCEIVGQGGVYTLADLGSTNGTFVNGSRVERVTLSPDDRILVGSTVMQVVDEVGLVAPASPSQAAQAQPPPNRGSSSGLSGRLDQVALIDVLQLLVNGERSGLLKLSGAIVGQLTLRGGRLQRAEVDEKPHWSHQKALCRIFAAGNQGSFRFQPEAAPTAAEAEQPPATLEAQLLATAVLNDEAKALEARVPAAARLQAAQPLTARLSSLEAATLDLWQDASAAVSVQALLDRHPEPDVTLLRPIKDLVEAGYLQVAGEPPAPPA